MALGANKAALLGASATGATGFTIDQSARYDQNVSAYLQNPNSNAGDSQKKFTFSTWFKRGALGENMYFFQYVYAYNADLNSLYLDTNDKLNWIDISGSSTQMNLITNRVFRDPSAFYHIVVVWDTAQAVSSERAKMYINGVRETSFGTQTYPSLNADSGGAQRSGSNMRLAAQATSSGIGNYFDGYLAETHYSDNYAYESSNYGEFSNGIWIPKEVAISYGSAGFYFDYANASNLAANTKGKGNWVIGTDQGTGLAAHDQVTDTPTNNFCTINPIYRGSSSTEQHYGVVSNGNLFIEHNANYDGGQLCTELLTTGKWYWEVYIKAGGNNSAYQLGSGIAAVNNGYTKSDGRNEGAQTGEIGFNSYSGVVKFANSTTKTYSEAPFSDTNIIQVAVDADNGAIYYGKNGTFMGSGDPTSGASKTNAGATWTPASYSGGWVPTTYVSGGGVPEIFINFGQEGTFAGNITAGGNSDSNGVGNFKYSVPSGYLALCTKNLGS